jgi:hypothetical protein
VQAYDTDLIAILLTRGEATIARRAALHSQGEVGQVHARQQAYDSEPILRTQRPVGALITAHSQHLPVR